MASVSDLHHRARGGIGHGMREVSWDALIGHVWHPAALNHAMHSSCRARSWMLVAVLDPCAKKSNKHKHMAQCSFTCDDYGCRIIYFSTHNHLLHARQGLGWPCPVASLPNLNPVHFFAPEFTLILYTSHDWFWRIFVRLALVKYICARHAHGGMWEVIVSAFA